jgi:membrane-bound lytic murein transglycosylase D
LPSLRYLGLLALIGLLHACTHLPSDNLVPASKQPPILAAPPSKIVPLKPKVTETEESENEDEAEDEVFAQTADNDDLWLHLRQNFSILPKNYNSQTQEFIQYYVKAGRTVQRMLENSKPYLAYIVAELEKRNIPLEIALLPMIESHYTPTLYSPQQAAGLWQFIPSTGKRYGLKQNWWYDGRRDVVSSTQAALDYLQTLYRDMDNDWFKALAAYNCGEGRVKNEVARNKKQGKGTEYWDLDGLPKETRNYIPRLLAIAAIIKKPQRYGITPPPLQRSSNLRVVTSNGQIELATAAELAGLELAEFRRLNPGYMRWATDPDGPHTFLIPAAHARQFSAKVRHLSRAERMPTNKGNTETLTHRIRKGETLAHIARRYDTTVALLSQMNRLKKGQKLKVGATLIVPHTSHSSATLAAKSPPAVNASTGNKPKKPAKSRIIVHQVRAGDTLWNLARRYDTTVSTLVKLNGLSKHIPLRVGHTLKIPARDSRNI